MSRTNDFVLWRGILFALLLRAVLGAALLAVAYTLKVKRAANDVVTHTRKIFYAAAAHEHNGVLLQVVTFAADVSPDFLAIAQTHTCDLTQGRVRFLRSFRSEERRVG